MSFTAFHACDSWQLRLEKELDLLVDSYCFDLALSSWLIQFWVPKGMPLSVDSVTRKPSDPVTFHLTGEFSQFSTWLNCSFLYGSPKQVCNPFSFMLGAEGGHWVCAAWVSTWLCVSSICMFACVWGKWSCLWGVWWELIGRNGELTCKRIRAFFRRPNLNIFVPPVSLSLSLSLSPSSS